LIERGSNGQCSSSGSTRGGIQQTFAEVKLFHKDEQIDEEQDEAEQKKQLNILIHKSIIPTLMNHFNECQGF